MVDRGDVCAKVREKKETLVYILNLYLCRHGVEKHIERTEREKEREREREREVGG